MAKCEGCGHRVQSEAMLSLVNYMGTQKKLCSLCRERAGQMGQLSRPKDHIFKFKRK
jgi:hypothetical protein